MKFELNNLPRNCPDEEVIAEIKRVDAIIDKPFLIKKEYDEHGKMSSSRIQQRFGGWLNALIEAGLGHKYSGPRVSEKMKQQSSKYLSEEKVLYELKRIAKLLNQNFVRQEDIKKHSSIISPSTVCYKFGSWSNGIKKAGLEDSPGYNRKYSNEEYFENLLNVWTHHGRQPTYSEIEKFPSVISAGAYEGRFGTWRKALEAFVQRMNREENESEQPIKKEEIEELVSAEIKKYSVAVEDRRGVGLGLRYKVLSRDNFKCVKCGTSPATDPTCKLHIDHIVPFSKGGKTLLENLQTLCDGCNLGKGNRHSE